jgi:CRP/FNR family transcriptional regulator, cyclic AMP receptor protein
MSSDAGGSVTRGRLPEWPEGSLMFLLSEPARRDLLALGRTREFAAGARLMVQGEVPTSVMVLLSGYVKVTVDATHGRTALLAVRVAGDVVGELGCLEGCPRMATLTAVGAVWARVLTAGQFQSLLRGSPEVAVVVGTVVAGKLRWATRRRVDLGSYPVAVRLVRLLLDLADRYGVAIDGGVALRLALTQPELAALIGASEPAVHRALTDLRRRDLLVTGYRHTVIRNLAALRALAVQGVSAPIDGRTHQTMG